MAHQCRRAIYSHRPRFQKHTSLALREIVLEGWL